MDHADSSKDDSLAAVEKTDRGATSTGSAESAFVGREHEIAQGLGLLEEALAGRGRLLLVAGEAGIGKSRMADELAARARERGMRVAWGRCWEAAGAPAYWPWVQSLRSLIRNVDADQLGAQMGAGAGDIAQLVPELRATLGDLPTSPEADPDAARFRLFDSASTFLKNAADERPLMLVLDDLQVADTPSLLLLRFVAGALGDDRILILGTYRDTELGPDHPLAAAVTELAREQAVCWVTLRGLAEADVARVIAATAGSTPPDTLVRAVHDQTEGNPLFLGEVIRLLLEEGRLTGPGIESGLRIGMPRSVRGVIGQRLKHLPQESLHILTLASILGREFNLDALSRLAERPVDDVLAALDEPLAARVITDVPGTGSRLRFCHVVIRECLYDDIGRARRVQLHRLAAEVLESLYADDPRPHLAELARHFFAGAPGGDVEKAFVYARRAGDEAASLLAYEEAVRLYQMALQGMELGQAKDPRQECEVLLALGDAQGRAGDEAGAKQAFLRAAELARGLGLREHLARAALGYGGRFAFLRAGGDAHVIPLLEDALTQVGEGDSPLGARVRARLAGALRDRRSPEPRESLGREAVEMARRTGDLATLAYTLGGAFAALWKPDNPLDRLAIASEMVTVGERAGDREQVLHGYLYRQMVFFELGDIASVHRELNALDRITEALRQPMQSWLRVGVRSVLALLEGRFEDAQSLISETLEVGRRSNRSDAVASHTFHLYQLRKEQGRLSEIKELLSRSALEFTWYPMFRSALADLHCELGGQSEARAEFERIAAEDFAAVPFDNEWLFSLSLLSEVAHALGDKHRAGTLYERLLPYADRNAFAPIEGCTGSVSRCLGLLAATTSRRDQAARHFQEALEHNARMGARPWVAHTQHAFAAMLMNRDGPGDRSHAIELLRDALRTCDELGMPALRAKAADALAGAGVTVSSVGAAPGAGPSVPPLQNAVPALVADGSFRLEGEYWTIGYGGRLLRLKDSKGLRILARLLAEPGRPFPAVDLERLGEGGDQPTVRALSAQGAGELLDDEARRAYRARLLELRAAVDEEDSRDNAAQAAAMREEIDFITRELSRALGLGGRSRHAGSIAERARLNVTRAVKSAMRRIAATDAELAAHLEPTVRTGTVCVYSPDPRSPVGWHVSLGDAHQG